VINKNNDFLFSSFSRKIGFLILLLLISFSDCFAQSYSCSDTGTKHNIEELSEMIYTSHVEKIMILADSLLIVLADRGLLECEDALRTKFYKALAYQNKREHHKSLALFHEIIPFAIKSELWHFVAETHIYLALSHEWNGRKVDCKRNLDEAHALIKEHSIGELIPHLYIRASSYYRVYNISIDTAIDLAYRAIHEGLKYDDYGSISNGNMLIGMMENDPKKRLKNFMDARDVNLKTKAYHSAAILNNSVAGCYIEMGELDKAEEAIRNSFRYANLMLNEPGDNGFYVYQGKMSAHHILAQIYEINGIQDSVDHHQALASNYDEKIKTKTDQEKMTEIETKRAIENEKLKTTIVEDQLFKSRLGLFLTSALFLLSGLLLALTLKNRNKIKSQSQIILKQNDKLKELANSQEILLSEVHHRVKNNLQNIISLLTLQANRLVDQDTKQNIMDVSNKIHSIALIHEQLYRDGSFELIDLAQYFEDLASHYKSLNGQNTEFEYEINTNDIKLNIETVIPVGIISAEVITNSLKYAAVDKKLKIKIDATQENDDQYKLVIADNGIGYPEGDTLKSGSGLGMILLRSMSRQLLGKLNLKNDNGAVTELIFSKKTVSAI